MSWRKRRRDLVEETLAFVQEVANAEPRREAPPIQVVATVKSIIQPNLPKPKLFEREEIQQRVANFKATQHKFAREREEYYKATMAKIRAGSTGRAAYPVAFESSQTPPPGTRPKPLLYAAPPAPIQYVKF